MKKRMCRDLGLVVLFGALCIFGWAKEASAEVHVNIDVGIPAPIVFAAPPDVYVVPSGSSYVYMAPDYEGVYFYGGIWYRNYNERWYRSSHYNGDWGYIETSHVPQVIIVVPPEYIHSVPSGYNRIRYDDYHSNWQSWDERHHWDNYDWYQHERRDDTRRDRYQHIESYRQQRGVQSPQHQQVRGHEQRNIQSPQHQQVQGHQNQNVQKQQKQHVQKQQKQHVQKQHVQKQHVQKQQKQHVQKQQNQNGEKHQKQQGAKIHDEDKK